MTNIILKSLIALGGSVAPESAVSSQTEVRELSSKARQWGFEPSRLHAKGQFKGSGSVYRTVPPTIVDKR